MKMRKLSMLCALVLLAAAVLVLPVQAGRTVTPFTFQQTGVTVDFPYYVVTGAIDHLVMVMQGTVVSTEPRLNGGTLTSVLHGVGVYPNPHNVIGGSSWGPIPGTWQIITTGPGVPPSGWEGICQVHPWSYPAKSPDVMVVRATGNGFGAYKGTHIEWSYRFPWPFNGPADLELVVFSGEISENSK